MLLLHDTFAWQRWNLPIFFSSTFASLRAFDIWTHILWNPKHARSFIHKVQTDSKPVSWRIWSCSRTVLIFRHVTMHQVEKNKFQLPQQKVKIWVKISWNIQITTQNHVGNTIFDKTSLFRILKKVNFHPKILIFVQICRFLITDSTDWSLQYLIFFVEALSFKWHQNIYPLFSIGWVISNFVSQVKAKIVIFWLFALTWLTKLEITQPILKSG